jgi:integrase
MTVRRYTRKSRKDGRAYHEWIVDFYWQHDDGTRQRFRKKSPVNTKTGAEAYELRMRQTLMGGGQVDEPKAVLTLAEFKTRFLRDYAKPENKPSEYRSKEQILDKYLVPALGALPLNEIGAEQIAAYKAKKREARLSPKTINNHLIVLGKMLRVAVEWKVIKEAPAAKPLKVPPQAFDFLTEEQAARLVEASVGVEPWHTMIVLALRTGMRLGELRALHWQDVDFRRGKITVRRAAWLRIIGTPKNNRTREVPLTDATLATLKQLPRHLGS